jgi:hypothetical protein
MPTQAGGAAVGDIRHGALVAGSEVRSLRVSCSPIRAQFARQGASLRCECDALQRTLLPRSVRSETHASAAWRAVLLMNGLLLQDEDHGCHDAGNKREGHSGGSQLSDGFVRACDEAKS